MSANAFRRFAEREAVRPDLTRAWRAVFAVLIPLGLAAFGWLPVNAAFAAMSAQNVAMVDVRGSYTLRLGLLLAMTAILTGAATLGGMAANDVLSAVIAAGLFGTLGGLWRHLTPDYGAPLAISSILLFLISAGSPAAATLADHHGLGALVGGLLGVLLQIAYWPIRPQHPLRRAVADSWVAVADLFEALASGEDETRAQRLHTAEAALRTTLDQTYATLASNVRRTALHGRLEELSLAAARLSTRVVALNTALESALMSPGSGWLADALRPVLTSLTNLSRSAAITIVSHQPYQLAAFEVRLRRVEHLLRGFQTNATNRLADPATATHLREILAQIERALPELLAAVRATVDRAGERAAFSLELFDLQTWKLRPLASALNLNARVDPALIRFTARSTVLLMLGVAAFKLGSLPHGYWLPLTMIIVLQPDYGSTRRRAAQRMLGTIVGSLAGSVLLWLPLPHAVLLLGIAATIFAFAYLIRRNYALAVVFITVFVVLLTESHETVTVWFGVERIAITLAGGALALIAALFFWPVWERDRFPPVLAAALEASGDYLEIVARHFASGKPYDDAIIAAKRRAESANSTVFSALQRFGGDPQSRKERLEEFAALANGNQRLTRAFTVLALQLQPDAPLPAPDFASATERATHLLSRFAGAIRTPPSPAELVELSTALQVMTTLASRGPANASPREQAALRQCAVIATELAAMLVALERLSSANEFTTAAA